MTPRHPTVPSMAGLSGAPPRPGEPLIEATRAEAEVSVSGPALESTTRPPAPGESLTGAIRPGLRSLATGAWFLLPTVSAVALYLAIFPTLVAEWIEFPSLSHGFAVPLIAGYLLWMRRERILTTPPSPSVVGLPVLVAGLGLLIVGVRAEEPFVARVSLIVTLFGLSLFLGGRQLTRQLWPGIAYLLFMIPPPWATLKLMTYRSRLLDADISAWALQALGVPIHQDGVLLHLPNITLEVADACSSIPAIAALLSLGVAYASMFPRPLAMQVILIVSTLPLAIGANIFRIASTALAVYYIGPWTLGTVYHMFNGTVNFVLTFVLLMGLDAALRRVWRARA
jgi:exosortase